MPAGDPVRQFVVLNPRISPARSITLPTAQKQLEKLLGKGLGFTVIAVPSQGWLRYPGDRSTPIPSPAKQRIISLALPENEVTAFRNAVREANDRAKSGQAPFAEVGTDLALAGTEYFCPATLAQVLFGDRSAAARVTRARALQDHELGGANVNVLVIDQGLDSRRVKNFGGGWTPPAGPIPGMTRNGHGDMIVRNIQDASPEAIFWDLPLIPTQIGDIPVFLSTALAQLKLVRTYINSLKQRGQWLIVNAWAIFDRSTESPVDEYTRNTQVGGHPVNNIVGQMVDEGSDFVFGAGNCGQFCPDRRCGETDIGPGNSIWGANCHPQVVTVGATRTDLRWLGNSSQGPGQPLLELNKPDLCAPSNFREDHDAGLGLTDAAWRGPSYPPYFIANTGTSAACGLAAGVISALRSNPKWSQAKVPPAALKKALIDSARRTQGAAWNGRIGNGVMDAKGAFDLLAQRFP
jgi:hypothetical protein